MTREEFGERVAELATAADEIMQAKSDDYAAEFDVLDNFKRVGGLLSIEPRTVWAVYFLKHVTALAEWGGSGTLQSESIQERFFDAYNYIKLGYALASEELDA